MAQRYPQGEALLAACRSGRGVIVIVEGEREDEDAYFYGRWFGTLGREITFIPQNGWQRVILAVQQLRAELPPHRRIFGIVDRDFAPAAVLAAQAACPPADGIFRTGRYTLENYFLEPACWFAVLHTRFRGSLPAGWGTEPEVAQHLATAYQKCIDLTAWNLTVRHEIDRQPSGEGQDYKTHPDALTQAKTPPEQQLRKWGERRAAPQPLDELFRQNQAMLRALPQAEWAQWISGKVVLKVFLQALPGRTLPTEDWLGWYIDKHPTPPSDLQQLVEQILRHR